LFDLSLEGSGDRYTGACDLVEVARLGHFTDESRPWEGLGFDLRRAVPATEESEVVLVS
jgi:hypothetical protein